MNQDEFNEAERRSKLRMQVIYEGSKKPKREWVGLTEDEIPDIYVEGTAFFHGVKWAEARLKEKNT
jgi:hypothetical protein